MVKKKAVDNPREEGGRPEKIKQYLLDKRTELVWALGSQDFNNADIGYIFNVDRSVISLIMRKKPKDWKTKWIKTN
jgi:hypothetical protein